MNKRIFIYFSPLGLFNSFLLNCDPKPSRKKGDRPPNTCCWFLRSVKSQLACVCEEHFTEISFTPTNASVQLSEELSGPHTHTHTHLLCYSLWVYWGYKWKTPPQFKQFAGLYDLWPIWPMTSSSVWTINDPHKLFMKVPDVQLQLDWLYCPGNVAYLFRERLVWSDSCILNH